MYTKVDSALGRDVLEFVKALDKDLDERSVAAQAAAQKEAR
jgi:hypothetical protein